MRQACLWRADTVADFTANRLGGSELSLMKTLRREEMYANKYDHLDQLRRNIEEFIEEYYNRLRLHSALAYRPPAEEKRAFS
jgi:transposase InsO family protein